MDRYDELVKFINKDLEDTDKKFRTLFIGGVILGLFVLLSTYQISHLKDRLEHIEQTLKIEK